MHEWDDPTWIQVEIDEEYITERDRTARRDGWRPPVVVPDEWIGIGEAAHLMRSNYANTYRRLMVEVEQGARPFGARRVGYGWRLRRADVEAYVGRRIVSDDTGGFT